MPSRPEPRPPGLRETSRSVRVDPPNAFRGRRVLVVDDDQNMVGLECLVLTNAPAEVPGARSVRDTLTLAETLNPDVIVADLHMPEEDGLALLREMHGKDPHRCSWR